MNSSDANSLRQSSAAKNSHGKRKRSRPKRSSKRHAGRRRRPGRFGSSSSSRTASPRHSFIQDAQEEVNHMMFGPPQCNRFWDSYGQASEWQRQHLVAYWKSRAFALENENIQLRTIFRGMTNLFPSNTHQHETDRSGSTQQSKFCDYSVPNYCSKYSKGQVGEQANSSCRHKPAASDKPSTSQHESSWSSQYKTPKINVGMGVPSYLWEESTKVKKKVDNNFISTIAEHSEDGDESFEFEINEDMITFLEQSVKHKLEVSERRKREKFEREKEKRQDDYEASLPPQHIGKQRIAEMKVLYGEGAPKIIAMETSIKLTFERRLQRDNSKVWPVIPLKP